MAEKQQEAADAQVALALHGISYFFSCFRHLLLFD
jgi:hypothetical protein